MNAKRYAQDQGIAISTASTRIFNDGKLLDRLINGASITTRRLNAAIFYLDQHQRGVVSNNHPLRGTGAGVNAQDRTEIGFLKNASFKP